MIRLSAWLFLFGFFLPMFGQNSKGVSPSEGVKPIIQGDTWAVVVGISDYQNPDIPDLQYSNADANAFIEYLKSPSGGKIEDSHIKGLINEKATSAQFASALDWLLDKAKEGDQVIIYFSGHGDVERKTVSQPGFLLCWNSPSSVYMGGGTFGLSFLQEIINTLSTQSKAKVLVITDACHSGKLAGSEIGGMQATASNLAKQFANEIKLMSCQADELSLEGPQWGGGRGVFSYFLLRGLIGLADSNKDGLVSLFEIERYLSEKVPESTAPKTQIPGVFGAKSTILSKVDPASLLAIQSGEIKNAASIVTKDTGDPPNHPEKVNVFEKYAQFKNAIREKHLVYPEEGSAWNLYVELKDFDVMHAEIASMKGELAAALQDEAQQAINNYLNADPKELENRWNYDPKYEKFPNYLAKAAQLLGNTHYLYKSIKARELYYSGLNLRLKGQQNKDSNLFFRAIELQNQALEFEPSASFAFNELGYLYKLLKNTQLAIDFYNKAILYSPKWLMPRINLILTYVRLGSTEKVIEAGKEALSIDSNSYLVHYNLGVALTNLNDWTKARAAFEKALALKTDDRDALYNLSYVLYQEKDYAEAEKIVHRLMQLYPQDKDLYIPLTCIFLKKGQPDKAYDSLEEGLKNGFQKVHELETEPDLKDFIQTAKYRSLLKKYSLGK